MKIACMIHSLHGGGAERVMAGLANRLGGRGHEVTLITLDDAKENRHELNPDVGRIALDVMTDGSGIVRRAAAIRHRMTTLRGAIEGLNPDVVLSFCDRNNVLTLAATRLVDVPVVVSERSDPQSQSLGMLGQWARRYHYRRAARIVALNESAAAYLQPFHAQRVVVIPSAVNRPTITSDRGVACDRRIIVAIGRLEREKGFDRLIRAFAVFQRSDEGRDWKLRILGEGSQRRALENTINESGATGVTLPGWIQPVWEELSGATLFVLPSLYEGFPSALLEAMASGVPCVAVDCPGGTREVIEHDRNGLLVESSIDGLVQGMRDMATDPGRRERIGQAGREVLDRFSWEAMVDAYESLLIEVGR